MKVSKIFVMTVMAAGLMVTSCGSSKPVTQTQQKQEYVKPIKLEKNEVIEYAEKKPALRAWAEAEDNKENRAIRRARNQANANFAEKIKKMVVSVLSEEDDVIEITGRNNGVESEANDGGTKFGGIAETISKATLRNVSDVKTERYWNDGKYKVYVCVEFLGNETQLADALVNNTVKEIQQNVPDSRREKLEQNMNKLRERFSSELEKLEE
ncbi:MAG: hypothetical protein K2M94_08305 [Paramuribaculum sp.]|nr:hypothetical protein [Paramuribaculum sp.]